MPAPSEFEIQRAFVWWFVGVPDKIAPACVPGAICWHVPNGGARSAAEGKRFKESGVLAGVPDIHILWGGLHCIEFKRPEERGRKNGGLSDAQLLLHPRLVAAGARVATAYSLDQAKQIVRDWGLTIHGR